MTEKKYPEKKPPRRKATARIAAMTNGMPDLEPVRRLTRDLAVAATNLSVDEARYLVDNYYSIQGYRMASANQVAELEKSGEPHAVVLWLQAQMEILEAQVKRGLNNWISSKPEGQWAMSIPGIGPVLASGLYAHIDIERAPTVGHIWRFAGLDPTVTWGKGQKRPWNASLKTLCWKVGESFVKQSGRDNDIYGKIYLSRKAQEEAKNANHDFAEQAARQLASRNYGKETDAYAALIDGRLPQAQIHARAKRYAVKIFLSHLHHVMYELHYGEEPPKPYILTQNDHAHFITPPNYPLDWIREAGSSGLVVMSDED